MTPVRGLGNRLIRLSFFLLIGGSPGDLLSGYRVFNRRYRDSVRPRSSGFEIEAELTAEAIAGGFRIAEVAVPYRARIAGTTSKLRAFRDGRRILATILREGLRRRPLRLVALTIPFLGLGLWAVGVPSVWVAVLFGILILMARASRRGPEIAR